MYRKPLPGIRSVVMSARTNRLLTVRSLLAGMDIVEQACAFHHGLGLLRIRHIRDIYATTIVILAIKPPHHVLVIPCEIGRADKPRMCKTILHIIPISHTTLLLRIDLPE